MVFFAPSMGIGLSYLVVHGLANYRVVDWARLGKF